MRNQEENQFSLPMMTMFSVYREEERFIAHALDFDLVAAADSEEMAIRKLRNSVKALVEYGLSVDAVDAIICRAPDEHWKRLTPGAAIRIGEPIEICHQTMRVLLQDEYRKSDLAVTAA